MKINRFTVISAHLILLSFLHLNSQISQKQTNKTKTRLNYFTSYFIDAWNHTTLLNYFCKYQISSCWAIQELLKLPSYLTPHPNINCWLPSLKILVSSSMPVHFSQPQLQDHLPLSGGQGTRYWVFSHFTHLTGLLNIVSDLNKLRFPAKLKTGKL